MYNNNNNNRMPLVSFVGRSWQYKKKYEGPWTSEKVKKEVTKVDGLEEVVEPEFLESLVRGVKYWGYLDCLTLTNWVSFLSPWVGKEKEEKKKKLLETCVGIYSSYMSGGRCLDGQLGWEPLNKALSSVGVLFLGGYNLDASLVYIDTEEEKVTKVLRILGSWDYWEDINFEDNELYLIEEDNMLRSCWHSWDAGSILSRSHGLKYGDLFTGTHGAYFNDYWTQCDECGDLHSSDSDSIQWNERLCECICDDCLERLGWVWCRDSREWVNPSEGVYPSCCDCCCGCYFSDCELYEENNINSTGDEALDGICSIRDAAGYSSGSVPSALVIGSEEVPLDSVGGLTIRKGGLFCGLEIETAIEKVDDYAALERVEYLYNKGVHKIKEDGSLDSGEGQESFEFVTLKLFNALEPDSAGVVRDLVYDIEEAGFWPDSHCGGHIHFDRLGIYSSEHWLKLGYVIENTSPEVLVKLFGRSFGSYCGKLGVGSWSYAWAKVERGDSWDSALESLNTSSHGYFLRVTRSTVEIRLFDGVRTWVDSICWRCIVIKNILDYVKDLTQQQLEEGLSSEFLHKVEEEYYGKY